MKTFKIVLAFIIGFCIYSCDNTADNEIIIKPFPPSNVNTQQAFSYKNRNGEGLFNVGIYKTEYLSLIATDENFNDLYIDGILVADIENVLGIADINRDEQGNVIGLNLGFGRDFDRDETNNSAIGYYKMKYNENKYDTIIVHFYHNLQKGTQHYITSVVYNGAEYPATGIIEIIKEE